MGRAEEDRACERLTHTKASPPTPLRKERGVDSEIPLIKPHPPTPLLQRGGVLDTVRWGEDEKFSLSSLLKGFPIQRCYEPFFK